MPDCPIPFNKPTLTGREIEYIRQAVDGGTISGDGPFTRRCEDLLENALGAGRVLLTTSCTHALEMSALLLDLKQGDEIILPSFTFVSTANAFVMQGLRPVFADVRTDTLNIDEERIEPLLSKRTKAVVAVHYGGVGCAMEALTELAEKQCLALIEDNAHGLFGRYRGRPLGTFGVLATQSFHETKNIICGEGGALVVNDERLVERAEIIREKGTNRTKFFRGDVDKYTWVDLGSSYAPSDILAAFLYAQLEQRERLAEERRKIWEHYDRQLRPEASSLQIRLPVVPLHCDPTWHLYYVILPTAQQQQQLIRFLAERRIMAIFHYQPLHLSPMGKKYGGKEGACPVSEKVSSRIVRLPIFPSLTRKDQDRVITALMDFFGR